MKKLIAHFIRFACMIGVAVVLLEMFDKPYTVLELLLGGVIVFPLVSIALLLVKRRNARDASSGDTSDKERRS